MILTVTANPAVDRTMRIDRPVRRHGVHRAVEVVEEAGGKGVNVARALARAGVVALAVFPADEDDLLVRALRAAGAVPVHVPTGRPTRVNVKIVEPDGSTTTVNDPGAAYGDAVVTALEGAARLRAVDASWVALSGSLPPGMPDDWYARLTATLAGTGARVAVDTSGPPLAAALAGPVMPDLLKPNAEELASLTGADPDGLEEDPELAAGLAARLVGLGCGAVLATLGAHGAVLVTPEGAWAATPPPITLRSTVGAGDASLAGYLIAESRGAVPAERLRQAVAYGAAAAALPGSAMPRPGELRPADVAIRPLVPASTT